MPTELHIKNRNRFSLRRAGTAFCLFAVFSAPAILYAPPPTWWTTQHVFKLDPITNEPVAADDYAVANIGQLKHFASKAYAELQAKLPGGAGAVLSSLVTSWYSPPAPGVTPDDYAALTLGQLKYVSKPFFDRLMELGYTHQYNWSGMDQPADDSALANIGQLKAAFLFNSFRDEDGDGLPDDWEIMHGLSPQNGMDGGGDLDGDGLTNEQEYFSGTDPLLNPNLPAAAHIPDPPANVRVVTDSSGGISVSWESGSTDETYFVVRDYREDGSSVELGRVGPGKTSIYIPPYHQ